jgi:hypothetical protein
LISISRCFQISEDLTLAQDLVQDWAQVSVKALEVASHLHSRQAATFLEDQAQPQ